MAGRIPEPIVTEILQATDLVELVGEQVPIKKVGRSYVARCPFHEERTPSFTISPEKQVYHCFGCQAGGNAFTYVMEREGLDFPGAVRWLAERAGIRIPETRGEVSAVHEALYAAAAFGLEYFRDQLAGPSGAGARAYLESRGIGPSLTETFQVGYAPPGWQGLVEASRARALEPQSLVEGGLLGRSDRSGRLYDLFRNRLMFPILDLSGRPIGFGGRSLGGEDPKYLNTSETPLFHKRQLLFNLSQAKGPIRQSGQVLVTEGYTDVLALHEAGFEAVVAPLGTALSEEQGKTLRRYTSRAILLYDGDEAGLRATFRSGDNLLRAGLSVEVVLLPPGEDPDSLVREGGRVGIQGALDGRQDLMETKLVLLRRQKAFETVEGRRLALDRLLASVVLIPDELSRELYVTRLAEEFEVSQASLRRELAGRERSEPVVRRQSPGAPREESLAERYLIQLMLLGGAWPGRVCEAVEPEDLTVPRYRTIYELLRQLGTEELTEIREAAFRELPRELGGVLSGLYLDLEAVEPAEETLRDCLTALRRRRLEAEASATLADLQRGLGGEDYEAAKARLGRLTELKKRRSEESKAWSPTVPPDQYE